MRVSAVRLPVVCAWLVLVGCGPLATSAVPAVKPVVVSWEVDHNLWTDNEVHVTVRNDGEAGPVRIEAYTTYETGHFTRGESDLEGAMRKTFTRELEPPARYESTNHEESEGVLLVHFNAQETKTVTITLPYYHWSDGALGSVFHVRAEGFPPGR